MRRVKNEDLKLDELAARAKTSARTVRYYVQRGLLPPPVFRGKDSAYGEGHLLRLRAIQALQAAFLPLDAIKATLAGASERDLEKMANGDLSGAHVQQTPHVRRPAERDDAVNEGHARAKRTTAVRWEKIVLMPGVELLVSDEAEPAAKKFAERTIERADKEQT